MPDNAMVGQIQSDDASSTTNPRSSPQILSDFIGIQIRKSERSKRRSTCILESVCDLERE